MQFGAFFLAGSPTHEDPSAVFKRVMRFVEDAEECGLDSVWLAEHHFSNYGYIPNPLLMATHVAGATSRIRIGTAVLVLPFWNPLRVAEDIALTDQLTGGRLEVGVARGYQPFEYRRFGVDQTDSRAQTDETLAVMLKALTEDAFSFDGEHHHIPETTLFPRPRQRPHPPIWLGAHTKESFDIAARFGLRAFTTNSGRPITELQIGYANYLEARAQHPSAPSEFGVQLQVCVTETDAEARAQMQHFRTQLRQVAVLRAGREHVVSGVTEVVPFEAEPDDDEMFENRALAGTPDRVVAALQRYRDACPMTLLNCTFHAGDMDPDVSRRSMRLFASEVMPHFR